LAGYPVNASASGGWANQLFCGSFFEAQLPKTGHNVPIVVRFDAWMYQGFDEKLLPSSRYSRSRSTKVSKSDALEKPSFDKCALRSGGNGRPKILAAYHWRRAVDSEANSEMVIELSPRVLSV